jgi:hypothetical protein
VVVDGAVARNGAEPRTEDFGIVEGCELFPGDQEDLLDLIFGVGRGQTREQDRVHHAGIARVQLGERRLVAGDRAMDQLPQRLAHVSNGRSLRPFR